MTKADRDALKACMDLAMREPSCAEQLRDQLKDGLPWEEVSRFACDCVQSEALHLKPWEESPCVVDEDDPEERDKQAQHLLRQMLAAGVSRYDPDPLAALEAAAVKR